MATVSVVVLILNFVISPLLGNMFTGLFWSFSYRFSIASIILVMPVFLVLGVALPLMVYRFVAKRTIVERLRDID